MTQVGNKDKGRCSTDAILFHSCGSPDPFPKDPLQRMPKGGGKKEGGAKPHEETPHGKQFPTPLTSVRFAPPPPMAFLLVSLLEVPRISLS